MASINQIKTLPKEKERQQQLRNWLSEQMFGVSIQIRGEEADLAFWSLADPDESEAQRQEREAHISLKKQVIAKLAAKYDYFEAQFKGLPQGEPEKK